MNLNKFGKFGTSLSIIAGTCGYYYYYHLKTNENRVFASWTTDYEPSFCARWDNNWDRRAPKSRIHPKHINDNTTTIDNTNNSNTNGNIDDVEQLQRTKAVRHLILIRHGQYNLDGDCDDNRYLTNLGRLQAQLTGQRLKQLNLPYTLIVKSTMTRAQETGTIIAESLPDVPVVNCELLREGAPIPPEPPIGSWKQNLYQFYVDGARIEAAFRKYFHRADPKQNNDSYTILVCHANVIRYFVCRALQFPAEAWLRMSLNHGSITWISITPSGRVVLRCLGDSGYMPPEAVTSH